MGNSKHTRLDPRKFENDIGPNIYVPDKEVFELQKCLGTRPEDLRDPKDAEAYRKWLKKQSVVGSKKQRSVRTRFEIETLIRSNIGRHYVYVLLRPDGTPFYVGEGKGRRIFFHEQEALGSGMSYKLNIIRHIKVSRQELRYEIIAFFMSQKEALEREVAEIRRIGRHDMGNGPLTNLTAGGEGASDLSEETKRRHDANLHGPDAPGERGIANRFYQKLCSEVRSVPIRPTSTFVAQAVVPHRQRRKPTKRMVAALAASAIANRVLLEPGCVIPRKMTVEGVLLSIENGAAADILRAGMATLVPGRASGDEWFRLSKSACNLVVKLSNRDLLLDAGILMPTF